MRGLSAILALMLCIPAAFAAPTTTGALSRRQQSGNYTPLPELHLFAYRSIARLAARAGSSSVFTLQTRFLTCFSLLQSAKVGCSFAFSGLQANADSGDGVNAGGRAAQRDGAMLDGAGPRTRLQEEEAECAVCRLAYYVESPHFSMTGNWHSGQDQWPGLEPNRRLHCTSTIA